MAQHNENNPIYGAVELLKTHGFDGLAEAVTVLLNTAMVAKRSDDFRKLGRCQRETEFTESMLLNPS